MKPDKNFALGVALYFGLAIILGLVFDQLSSFLTIAVVVSVLMLGIRSIRK